VHRDIRAWPEAPSQGRPIGGVVQSTLLLLGLGVLMALIASQWHRFTQMERCLDVPLIATTRADYGANWPVASVAQVDLDIIKEMIRDSAPETADLSARLSSAEALLRLPAAGETPPPPAPVLMKPEGSTHAGLPEAGGNSGRLGGPSRPDDSKPDPSGPGSPPASPAGPIGNSGSSGNPDPSSSSPGASGGAPLGNTDLSGGSGTNDKPGVSGGTGIPGPSNRTSSSGSGNSRESGSGNSGGSGSGSSGGSGSGSSGSSGSGSSGGSGAGSGSSK
jgi:hypothetical protein